MWILAERLHLSGILTTVVYAMAISRRAGGVVPARIRIPSYAVWEVAVFVLNVLAFILVGLQLRTILVRLDAVTLREYLWVAGAVCVVIVQARVAWVAGVSVVGRALGRVADGSGRGLSAREAIEAALLAERRQLLDLRAGGHIGDAAFQQIEQELDWAELDLRQAFRVP